MAAKAKARTKAKPKARSKARSGGKAVRAGAGGRPGSTRTAKGNGQPRDLLSRLRGGAVICAEGYVFELERRGYLQAGAFVPEVLFDHLEVVEQLHMDFVHAGSDVTQALTYYVHREKLRVIGREKGLVPMNRAALRIAKSVARRTGTLFAGDICNTNIYDPADKASIREVERIYHEQVGLAVEAGVDYFVADTIGWIGEALMALEAIKKYSKVPAVVTLAMHREALTRDGLTPAEACKRLEDAGADVVGLNCHRGPATMLPMLKEIRAAVKCHGDRSVRDSALALVRGALSAHRHWAPVWRSPEPKPSYDIVIVGGGGHGLATAYYLAKNHRITKVAVLERGWLGGGNTGRNTTVVRSNYLYPESARLYDFPLRPDDRLSRELT